MRVLYTLACVSVIAIPLALGVASRAASDKAPQKTSPIYGVSVPDGYR
jgi:hypothetical protein